jgi:hypothetical protein
MVELYKYIIIGHPTFLRNLMRDPHPDSYHLIKTLDIAHAVDEDFPELDDDVEDRIFQLKGLAYANRGDKFNWTSSLDAARRFKTRWASHYKPQLKILKGSGVNDNVVACLLKL